MSIRFRPEEIPSVEKRGQNEWFCSMCRCTFDYEGFALACGCPGCERMTEAEQGRRGAL